jgi:CDP-diacylglycerol--glycerol-3-phosphate 3-phosphatidyltransferase
VLTALLLGAAGATMLGWSLATARRPTGPIPDRADYLRRWAPLHGDYLPAETSLAGRWLSLAYAGARPLAARGISPDVMTLWGVLLSAAVPAVAGHGGRWPLLAVAVVVASGLFDNLDGAVAVLAGRTTRWGFVLDSLADRLSDAAYLFPLWMLGAPGPACVAGGGLMALQEYARARAGNAGMGEIGVITIWERPTRVILTAFVLLGCGLLPGRADTLATVGAAAWIGLGAIGLTQLLLVVRRILID